LKIIDLSYVTYYSKDAERAVKPIIKKLKYHQINYYIENIEKHTKRGRPGKDSTLERVDCRVNSAFIKDDAAMQTAENRLGRFVLATNELDLERLSDKEFLSEYKGLSQNENGFRFIKDTKFCIDSVFLKTPARIEALMMVMTLCLMVYNVGQHKLRNILEEKQETIPSQVKKPISNPTLQWVFRILDTISVVRVVVDRANNIIKELTGNLTELSRRIIGYFGEAALKIYGVT
jgi:transposase